MESRWVELYIGVAVESSGGQLSKYSPSSQRRHIKELEGVALRRHPIHFNGGEVREGLNSDTRPRLAYCTNRGYPTDGRRRRIIQIGRPS